MKTDHFAEFRPQHIEYGGYEGYGVTQPERPRGINDNSSADSVTHDPGRRVTQVTGSGPPLDVTHVTQPLEARVTDIRHQKPEESRGNSESVTPVTHVTQSDNEVALDAPAGPCCACHGCSFWRLSSGPWICDTCHPPVVEAQVAGRHQIANGCAIWPHSVTPNSRHPLVPPEVRTKIEAIERDARRMGWPPELLWNSGFWDCPRGLASLLDADDEIAEVQKDYIAVLKVRRDLLQFRRHAG